MIMVAIGMTTTAGSGVFGFIGRIAGTGKPAPTFTLDMKLNFYQQLLCAQVLLSGTLWMVILRVWAFLYSSLSLLSSTSSSYTLDSWSLLWSLLSHKVKLTVAFVFIFGLRSASFDHWVWIGGKEDWGGGECSPDQTWMYAHTSRWLQAMDNLTTLLIYLHLTD